MKTSTPSIRVKVDPANPGQFFACCGLLEIGHRLFGDCCGRFQGMEFLLHGRGIPESADALINRLLTVPEFDKNVTKKAMTGESKSKLIPIGITFGPTEHMRLDWWRDDSKRATKVPGKPQPTETCASSRFKTWTANQSPQQILYDRLLPAIRTMQEEGEGSLFHGRAALTGRFGFDPVAASIPIDVGWSPDKLDIPVATSPAVELLAAIGLQRFRPRQRELRSRDYLYSTWNLFLSPNIAAAACACVMPQFIEDTYQFSLGERGDYKYFEYATMIGGSK